MVSWGVSISKIWLLVSLKTLPPRKQLQKYLFAVVIHHETLYKLRSKMGNVEFALRARDIDHGDPLYHHG